LASPMEKRSLTRAHYDYEEKPKLAF
jgi:hypothetical protein